jgi:dTDP-4-amino-4,6-dideoxygalactose transaminase
MGKLALTGGTPLRTKSFPTWPVYDEHEVKAVTDVVESGKWWRFGYATGVELNEDLDTEKISKTQKFSREFARYHEAEYGIAVANGTGSLEIIFKALGIGPGDEVIVPAYTYIASATAILQVLAVPIFVDIDPDTYGIDPDRLEQSITPRTKAIEPVHFGGQPVDMDRILAIAKKHNLAVVEDAAHAHGSEWRGRKVGALGTAGSFSFQASKNMTAGEGGIIVTNDAALADRCDSYLWAGREKGHPWYEFHRLGWNYRITEFQSAILLEQLKRLERQNQRRMENARYLDERLNKINGIRPLVWDERATKHSHHIYIFRYDAQAFKGLQRDRFVEALVAEGVPAFTGYTFPLYANPMFLNKDFYPGGYPLTCREYDRDIDFEDFAELCPVTERACYSESVWLEHRLLLGSKADMDDIINAVAKVKERCEELL